MPLPAPFLAKVGNFTGPGGTGNSAVTGVGFKPKAVILFSAGNDSSAAWQGDATAADLRGMTISMFTALDAVAVYESSDDNDLNQFQTGFQGGIHKKAFRVQAGVSPFSIDSEASFVSMDTDGFTLNWTTVASGATQPIIGYVALGGDSLVAKIVKWRMPSFSGTGSKIVTGVGFKPDVVFHLFGDSTFFSAGDPPSWPDGSFNGSAALHLGAMDKLGNQWAMGIFRQSVSGLTDSNRVFSNQYSLYAEDTPSGGPGSTRASFVSMDTDGFTLNYLLHNAQQGWVASLALLGMSAKVGTTQKPTGSEMAISEAAISEAAFSSAAVPATHAVSVGFQPSLVLLAGIHAPTLGNLDDAKMGFGAASATTQRMTLSRHDLDFLNPSDSKKRTRTDRVYYGRREVIPGDDVVADLASFDAGGLTLTWNPNNAVADQLAYIALGGSPQQGSVHRFEMELNGLDGGWTNVTEDVILDSPSVDIQYGISGTGPRDLVASTGTMKFALNNSADNSAGRLGYYSPRHPNRRLGFQLGLRVRYTYLIPGTSDGCGKFIGRLREIEPKPGQYRDRKTHCLAVDWMNEAAITKYNAPTQVGKRADEILTTIVALVPRQPDSTSYDVADSTFLYALDSGLTEGASVITEIQRICQSEYGRCYVKGGLNVWGKLRFEKRTARLIPQPVATFDGTMQDLDSGGATSKVKNKATVTAHPRRVDAVNTIVLFAKPSQSNPSVTPATTIKMSGKYVDPGNPNARVGGTDMIAPAATTDYLMNAAADGSGANLTANFTVTPVYGANKVDYSITNNGGTTGYVTKLQARGRGLYDYDPIDAGKENAASVALIGESVVTLDMLYQSAFAVAEAVAQFLVDTWSVDAGATEASIRYIPRTEAELEAAMALEVGDAISVIEALAVVNDVYYIQNVGIKISGDKVTFDWDLQRAIVQSFWTLGASGYSELGVTTVLAPL